MLSCELVDSVPTHLIPCKNKEGPGAEIVIVLAPTFPWKQHKAFINP
jgi:hypothetical protein